MPRKKTEPDPGRTWLLPQYIASECMYDRYIDAQVCGKNNVERSKGEMGKIKIIENDEIEADNFIYFIKNKNALEKEFSNELNARGIKKKRIKLFCEIISNYWYDGFSKRKKSKEVQQLFASIENYFLKNTNVNTNKIRVRNKICNIEPNFTANEIEVIISINKEMFDGYIDHWIAGHPKAFNLSTSHIFCRRGLYLKKYTRMPEEYLEHDYISSYSLAFSVTEKFAQMVKGYTPAIIHTNIANVRDRILFFSPFIQGMHEGQFEFGVIPHWWRAKTIYQGIHGGIKEYLID